MSLGLLYRYYMDAVRAHGYESPQACAAFEKWSAASGFTDRAGHTARPAGDRRPLHTIYPTGRRLTDE